MRTRIAVLVLLGLVLSVAPVKTVFAAACQEFACEQTADGVALSARKATAVHAPLVSRQLSAGKEARVDRTVSPGCPLNDPNNGPASYDLSCQYMTSACQARGLSGWLVWVWTRPVASGGAAASRWVKSGFACRSPQQVQAAAPGVTRVMVERAFRRLVFARPGLHVQPEGDVTLVNLPTYFQVRWPVAGLQPGEVAVVRLLGREVRLRPKVVGFTYRFGDGASAGPTSDAGGLFPSGGVRHTYLATGVAPVQVEVTYTGEYALPGGAWAPIDVVVPVAGDRQPLQVKQARARLETTGSSPRAG